MQTAVETAARMHVPAPNVPVASGISTFADLFCGIGGFHYAAADLGLRCVFACDIDEDCRRQYKHSFGIDPLRDIRDIHADDIPSHDILFAGFPCQPFSIIGDMQGMDDDRGTLFRDIIRIMDAKKPKVAVLENVRQLATISQGEVLQRIISGLGRIGYSCQWKILNALDYGLPQKRERIIIVAFLAESMKMFSWPKSENTYTPLGDILEVSPDKRYYASQPIREKRHRLHKSGIKPAVWHENKGGNISSHPFSCALRANASHNYLLVDGERRFTPREQLRLQGFPDSFEILGNDSQIRKQTGNAVPVPMVRAVIKEVIHAYSKNS